MKKSIPKDPSEQMVADLKDGLRSPFWLALKKVTEDNIADVQRDINNANEDGISNEKLRNLIDWRNFLEYFLSLPDEIIASIEQGQTDPVDFDPYKTVKDSLGK